MNTTATARFHPRTGLLLAALLVATTAGAQTVTPSLYWNTVTPKENWVSFSVGSVSIDADGDAGAFQARRQTDESSFGGVDSFRHRSYLDNNIVQTIEGRGLWGSNEYRLTGRWEFTDSGSYIEAGYRESRVFYDGSGGTVSSGEWLPVIDDRLATDRSLVWVEGAWVRDANTTTLRIAHAERDGTKDSTSWGDANTSVGRRYIVPAFWALDETRTTVTADFEHAGETTTLGGGIRIEEFDVDNSRNIRRRPGESSDRHLTHRDQSDSDLFSVHAYSVSRHGEKLTLSGAAAYTSIDTNLDGQRTYGSTFDSVYDPNFARRQWHDHGYFDLHGDSNWDQMLITGNALYLPDNGWRVNAGLRFENQSQDLVSEFIETAVGRPPALPSDTEEFEGISDRDFDELLGNLELTHTGIRNWVISGFVELSMGDGDLAEELIEPELSLVDIERGTDFDRDSSKYGVTARWYPATDLNFAAGAYHKVRDNDYNTQQDSTPVIPPGDESPSGDRYPAFITSQKFSTDDLYVRGTWRPATVLALTGRYDYQQTDIKSQEDGLSQVLAGDMTTHIIAATVTLTPVDNLIIQAGTNWIYDEINTGLTGPAALVVPGTDNNYRIHTLMAILALNEQVDVSADYYYYSANNFDDISEFTVPYGVSARDESASVTVNYRVNEDLALSLRYGHGKYEDITAGGNNDFDYDLIYGRMQLRY